MAAALAVELAIPVVNFVVFVPMHYFGVDALNYLVVMAF